MLAWQNSGFSIDASVRVALVDRDVPSYFKSLEHLLRYCGRPAFARERLSLLPGRNGGPERIRYALPRHKRGQWVGPGRRRKAAAPGENGVVDLSPFEFLDRLGDLVPPPRKHRHRPAGGWHGGRAKPRLWLRPPEAAGAMDGPAAMKQAMASSPRMTRSGPPSRRWRSATRPLGAPIRKLLTHLDEPLDPPPLAPARGPPTVWAELVQVHDDRDAMQAAPDELPVIDIRSL